MFASLLEIILHNDTTDLQGCRAQTNASPSGQRGESKGSSFLLPPTSLLVVLTAGMARDIGNSNQCECPSKHVAAAVVQILRLRLSSINVQHPLRHRLSSVVGLLACLRRQPLAFSDRGRPLIESMCSCLASEVKT